MLTNIQAIKAAYHELLMRVPMPAETGYWLASLSAGCSLEEIRAEIKESHEYQTVQRQLLRQREPEGSIEAVSSH